MKFTIVGGWCTVPDLASVFAVVAEGDTCEEARANSARYPSWNVSRIAATVRTARARKPSGVATTAPTSSAYSSGTSVAKPSKGRRSS